MVGRSMRGEPGLSRSGTARCLARQSRPASRRARAHTGWSNCGPECSML